MRRTGGPASRRIGRPAQGQNPDRRIFLGAVGGLLFSGLTGFGPADCPTAGPLGRRSARAPARLGIQLYTVRDQMKADFEGTLAALAQMGYREVEFAGLYGRPANQVRSVLDGEQLGAPSGHYGIPAITDSLDQTIAEAKTLGHRYVVVPWLPEELRTADGYARIAQTFNRAGKRLRKAGLTLGYHNHWFEFDPLDGGRCGYDILLERTDPALVTMELDLFWIRKGGRDALAYFTGHKGRFRLIHIKDMAADGAMVDVGQGAMDWPALLEAATRAGVQHRFVEHDEAKDPLAFARTSQAFMARLGI